MKIYEQDSCNIAHVHYQKEINSYCELKKINMYHLIHFRNIFKSNIVSMFLSKTSLKESQYH